MNPASRSRPLPSRASSSARRRTLRRRPRPRPTSPGFASGAVRLAGRRRAARSRSRSGKARYPGQGLGSTMPWIRGAPEPSPVTVDRRQPGVSRPVEPAWQCTHTSPSGTSWIRVSSLCSGMWTASSMCACAHSRFRRTSSTTTGRRWRTVASGHARTGDVVFRVDVVGGSGRLGRRQPAGHAVVVDVGLEDVRDPHPAGAGHIEHPVEVTLRAHQNATRPSLTR